MTDHEEQQTLTQTFLFLGEKNMANEHKLLSFDVGALQATTKIELHTHHAAKHLFNRLAEDRGGYTVGLTSFMSRMSVIHLASADDDPYADFLMLRIERKILQTRKQLTRMQEDLKELMAQLPAGFTVSKTHSIKPFQLEVRAISPLAYQGAYVMLDFDEYIANVMQLRHIGLMTTERGAELVKIGGHLIRSLLTMVQDYRPAGVSRDDMAANNARAREAIAKYGILPQDVLEGTRRSAFAPFLNRLKQAKTEARGESNAEDEPTFGQARAGDAAMTQGKTEEMPEVVTATALDSSPDSAPVVMTRTRRRLKQAVITEDEVAHLEDDVAARKEEVTEVAHE